MSDEDLSNFQGYVQPRADTALPPGGTHTLALLPPGPAARLAHLIAIRDDAHALTTAALSDQTEVNAELKATRLNLTRTTSHPKGNDPEDVRRLEAAVERAQSKAETTRNRFDARQARWNAAGQLVNMVETFVRRSPVPLQPHDHRAPKLSKGETLLAAVERTRAAHAKLAAELHKIRSAPRPSTECLAMIHAQVETIAKQGQPDVYPLLELAPAFDFAQSEQFLPTAGLVTIPAVGDIPPRQLQVSSRAFLKQPDPIALLAWVMKDKLIELLAAELKLVASDGSAIASTERAARTSDLLAQILACERDECELTIMAEAQGQEIVRRPDTDPRALLGVL